MTTELYREVLAARIADEIRRYSHDVDAAVEAILDGPLRWPVDLFVELDANGYSEDAKRLRQIAHVALAYGIPPVQLELGESVSGHVVAMYDMHIPTMATRSVAIVPAMVIDQSRGGAVKFALGPKALRRKIRRLGIRVGHHVTITCTECSEGRLPIKEYYVETRGAM